MTGSVALTAASLLAFALVTVVGLRQLRRDEFLKGWSNGVMLLLQPDHSRLGEQAEDTSHSLLRFLPLAMPRMPGLPPAAHLLRAEAPLTAVTAELGVILLRTSLRLQASGLQHH